MSIDRPLATHEAGHSLEKAAMGGDLIVIKDGHDDRGYYAQTNGYCFGSTGLQAMPTTVASAVAGPAFTLMLCPAFERFSAAEKLREPIKFITAAAAVGICPDDLEDLQRIKANAADINRAARTWMLVAAWLQTETLDFIVDHIVAKMNGNETCVLQGKGLRQCLGNAVQQFHTLAEHPTIFTDPGSVNRLIADLPTFGTSPTPISAAEAARLEAQT
jgi:hypothetical protein